MCLFWSFLLRKVGYHHNFRSLALIHAWDAPVSKAFSTYKPPAWNKVRTSLIY